jgi:two-component system nitrate/nitrite response regulator NarL
MKSENSKSRPVIGVLIIDDHLVVRTALRALLEKQPGMVVVGEASNKNEAVALASREQPEIVVLDLCLKEENGLDLIPELLAAAEESKIIILTGVTDPEEHQKAIRQGAMGVVSKEVSADLLIKAIERVHAGELWLNRHMTATLVKELRRERASVPSAPEEDATTQLTCREREIIGLIGEGLKNKQIAGRLCISEATVRHHLTSILRKLEVSDRLELLIFAYRHNLVTMEREHSTARMVN